MPADALLDSNVLVAAAVENHPHHEASLNLLLRSGSIRFAVGGHSIAEAYVTLTRQGDQWPYRKKPAIAWGALESLTAGLTLVGLSPRENFEAVRRYAAAGGVGPRIYDALIGEAARVNGLGTIITWNIRHMSGLFPGLQVVTPADFLH